MHTVLAHYQELAAQVEETEAAGAAGPAARGVPEREIGGAEPPSRPWNKAASSARDSTAAALGGGLLGCAAGICCAFGG